MQIAGIIAEYNPFHRGHLYHIQRTKEAGATHIVAVMSGDVVQRGDVAILSKRPRTLMALRSGVDLVAELPAPFALSSAERFARGAVGVISALGCVDLLSFGSETGDVGRLLDFVKITSHPDHFSRIRETLKSGVSFPRASAEVLESEFCPGPNDTLALEYLRALKKQHCAATPFTVKREGTAHDADNSEGNIASASYIRRLLFHGDEDAASFVPETTLQVIKEEMEKGDAPASMHNAQSAALYRIRNMSREEIALLPDVTEGLENRIYKYAKEARSLEELYTLIKTKRYTMARIRRIIAAAMIGLTAKDQRSLAPYVRILGFNQKGIEILAKAKTTCPYPMLTSLRDIEALGGRAARFANLESAATDLQALCRPQIGVCGLDYMQKPVIIR